MIELDHHLSTHSYLEEIKQHFPNDPRLEIYAELQKAVSKIDPFLFLTITFRSRVTDEILCENICQRIVDQLQHAVVGKHQFSLIPCFTVLEKSRSKTFHVHMLIGQVQGKTRSLSDTTFKSYLQKKPFSALFKILNRLTYKTKSGKPGKIGVCHFQTVYSKEGAIDYVLKALKPAKLNVAWLATYIGFSDSSVPVRPLRPKRPKRKKRQI